MGLISQHCSIQCGLDCRMIASICYSNALVLDDKEGVSELHHAIWHVCGNLAGLQLIFKRLFQFISVPCLCTQFCCSLLQLQF